MAKLTTKTTDQPPLLRVADDPTVQKLEAELTQFQERLAADTARLEQTARDLERAQADLDATESRLLAGRTDEATFAAAQATLAECKRAHAIAVHARGDSERMVLLLPAALAEARIAARVRVLANLRALYAAQLTDLKAKLQAAAEASVPVAATYARAREEFATNAPHPDYPDWFVCDLGDAGVTPAGGRLPDLTFAPVTPQARGHNGSLLEVWVQQVDALLAAIPEMAARDKEMLAARIAHEPERRAREAERVKLELAFARRDIQQFSITFAPKRGNGGNGTTP
jgi:hypothetical protein